MSSNEKKKIELFTHPNLDGYESQEDLEQLIRVTIKNSSNGNSIQDIDNENSEKEFSAYHTTHNNNLKFTSQPNETTINILRLLNASSIVILLITFFTSSIIHMNNDDYYLIIEYLRKDKIQGEGNLRILYIAFCFVTCK